MIRQLVHSRKSILQKVLRLGFSLPSNSLRKLRLNLPNCHLNESLSLLILPNSLKEIGCLLPTPSSLLQGRSCFHSLLVLPRLPCLFFLLHSSASLSLSLTFQDRNSVQVSSFRTTFLSTNLHLVKHTNHTLSKFSCRYIPKKLKPRKIQRMLSREDGSSPFPSISPKGNNYYGHPLNVVLPSYKYSHIVCLLYLNSSNSS